MDIQGLSEDIERVRSELAVRKRARDTVERTKIQIEHNIDQTRNQLDRALQVARRAQQDVTEAQKKFDAAMHRMHMTDQSLEQIAEEELELAAQLRDLSHQLANTPKTDGGGSHGSSHTGRSSIRKIR